MVITQLLPKHYNDVASIYLQGLNTGMASFQTEAPTWEYWDANHLQHSRLGAFINTALVGWAALSQVSVRPVYAGVAEVSIYIHPEYFGMGIGKKLLTALILQSEANGIWTLQSGIFEQNKASINLHLACGFRIIGFREKVGKRDNLWQNNVIMERRSMVVGV
jgi:L-amino acid N-acyltransferase YncA